MEMKRRKVRNPGQRLQVEKLVEVLIDVVCYAMHAIDIHIAAFLCAHRSRGEVTLRFGLMAHGFHVVAIRSGYECTEIIWMVDIADTGWAVVCAAGSHRRRVKGFDLITIVGKECNMHGSLDLPAASEPKFRLAAFAKPRPSTYLHHKLNAQRRQCAREKSFAFFVVTYGQPDVINDHRNSDATFCLV